MRSVRLNGGGSPCAGIPEELNIGTDSLRCELQKEEASVLCRELECGTALQWFRAHPGGLLGGQEQRFVTCQGTEPSIFYCKSNSNFLEQCDLEVYTEVVCTGRITSFQALDSCLYMNKEIKISAPSTQAVLRDSSSLVWWLTCSARVLPLSCGAGDTGALPSGDASCSSSCSPCGPVQPVFMG